MVSRPLALTSVARRLGISCLDSEVSMFPCASDSHWGRFLTHVQRPEFQSVIPVESLSHQTLAFLSSSFRGPQLRWSNIDQEGSVIVSSMRRLDYLLWNRLFIFADHRNLARIFRPEACIPSASWKTLAQRFENLRAFLSQFPNTIRHIPGDQNVWGHLHSGWVQISSIP